MYFGNILKSAALVVGGSFVLIGCGGGSSPATGALGYSGNFVDAPVSGIGWECGGESGLTDTNGEFGVCPAGSSVTFSVGHVVLGTVERTSDYYFTPQDVVGVARSDTSNDAVKNMSALLLSLDSDGDPSTEGIEITEEIVKAFNEVTEGKTTIEDLNLNDTAIAELILNIQIKDPTLTKLTVYTTEDAATHLDESAEGIANGDFPKADQPVDASTN